MAPDERLSPIRQETLTVLAKVDREPELRAALAAVGRDVFGDPDLAIHFARLALLPKDTASPDSSAWMALESNFDTRCEDDGEARQAHLVTLADRTFGTLRGVFECCEGFPAGATAGDLGSFWQRNLVSSTACYQGHCDREISRIRLEQHLREVILTFLESADRGSPIELFQRIRRHVRSESRVDPRLAGLDIDRPAPSLPDPKVRSQHLRENTLPWIKAAELRDVLPIAGGLPEAFLSWQLKDAVYDVRAHQEAWTAADRASFSAIAGTEDHGAQNALTHVVPVRDGKGRLSVLKHAHAIINRIAKEHFCFVGQLGNIPSIHFAKWLLFESDKRLLFFSNYDSSWESYLGDFVDQAAMGLNLAWSCTKEYPKTVGLAWEGATDEETFKSWGRAYQVPTQVFYSAYSDLTIEAINNNTWIRYGLHQRDDGGSVEGGLDAWMRRLT
jgi:hypothetical protein